MAQRWDRRRIIGVAGSMAITGAASSAVAAQEQEKPAQPVAQPAQPAAQPRPKKEPIKPELVREWVLVAHKDLERVKELYSQEPALLNASWDWGGGDWESALGAAAHTGQREIALFLLEKGARFDLFAATMLGHLDVVKTILSHSPALLNARGPHGIPLVVHARMGKEAAKPVFEYLEGLIKAQPADAKPK